jgi:4a-hydroxytetrahydrobiopterin dehydratase
MFKELKGWRIQNDERLLKSFKFTDFKSSLELANEIGELAERENHHPDLHVRWGELGIELWTHAVGGLTESDFILAAKIDKIRE